MKIKTNFRIQAAMNIGMVAWVALGVLAAYLVGGGQVGWFAIALSLLLATATGMVAEMRLARWTAETVQQNAQATVESWPHVIAVLEDLERIAPERAEMVQVAKLEMAAHLDRARVVAAGRMPSWRQVLKRHTPEDES